MKKLRILQVSLMLTGIKIFSQTGNVGINTSAPQATLDIRGKNDTGSSGIALPGTVSTNDGILVPRVNSLATNGSINGQLVYLVADSTPFTRGFHYWNGTAWTPLLIPAMADTTADAWVNNSSATPPRIELATNSDGVTGRLGKELVMTDAGNLGIGITNPRAQLDVRTSLANVAVARFGNAGQNIVLGVSSDNNGPSITTNIGTNSSLRLGVNNSEYMRIDASTSGTLGNVGIGVGNAAVNNALQIHRVGTTTDTYQQFTNGTSGITATDGLKIGISSTNAASIQNLEASSLSLHTNATERMTISSNGFVGIGTTTPTTKLDVFGTSWNTSAVSLQNTTASEGQNVLFTGDQRTFALGSYNSNVSPTSNSFFIRDNTANNIRLIISPTGNVGIGENSPTHKLQVRGGLALGNNAFDIDTNYADDNNYITFRDGTGTASEDFIGYKDNAFHFRDNPGGLDTAQPNVVAWGRVGIGTDNFTGLNNTTGLVIANTGGTAIAIRNGGDLDIYSPDNTQSARLNIDDGSSNTLTISSNGKVFSFNGTAGSVNSDIRLKQDIVKEENSLSKILQLNGYSYRFKKNASDPHKEYGVIAQEVIKVLPEAVYTDKDGYYSVSYSSLIPILINAIKEQQIQIDELKEHLKKH